MARGRSSGRRYADPYGSAVLDPGRFSRPLSSLAPLHLIEDLRRYDPARHVNARSLFNRFHRLVVDPNVNLKRSRSRVALTPRIAFANPERVVTCIKRKTRRQVMFAMRKTGKGAQRRRRHRNWRSNISC